GARGSRQALAQRARAPRRARRRTARRLPEPQGRHARAHRVDGGRANPARAVTLTAYGLQQYVDWKAYLNQQSRRATSGSAARTRGARGPGGGQAQSGSARRGARRQRVSKRQRPAARAAAKASPISRRVTRRLISWNFSSVSTRYAG